MPVRTRWRRAAAGLAAAALLVLAGCGPKFEYAEVQGKVTLDGQALSGVKVAFYPDNEGAEQLPYATGLTDGTGTYTLTAVTGKPGALVGKNRVVVNWPLPEHNPDLPPPPPPGPPIPMLYTQAAQTPLVVEVKPGPRQNINVELPK